MSKSQRGKVITITLPYPPSVNRYWRSFRGRNILSVAGRQYRKVAQAAIFLNGWRVTGPVRVTFDLYPPDKRRRDGDNTTKGMFDALVKAGAIEGDDSRFVREHTVRWREVDRKNPRVEVVITEVVGVVQ